MFDRILYPRIGGRGGEGGMKNGHLLMALMGSKQKGRTTRTTHMKERDKHPLLSGGSGGEEASQPARGTTRRRGGTEEGRVGPPFIIIAGGREEL